MRQRLYPPVKVGAADEIGLPSAVVKFAGNVKQRKPSLHGYFAAGSLSSCDGSAMSAERCCDLRLSAAGFADCFVFCRCERLVFGFHDLIFLPRFLCGFGSPCSRRSAAAALALLVPERICPAALNLPMYCAALLVTMFTGL